MIVLQGKVPRCVYIACSGGVDSMVAVDFLSRNHIVRPLFVHHGTETSNEAYEFLKNKFGNKLFATFITEDKPKNQSQEEFWRNQRYKVFKAVNKASGATVVTAHHLDDCMETWIWSSMHGKGKIILYRNQNVIRPFRLTSKNDFYRWAKKHNVEWVEDKSNTNISYMRNYIRHEALPHMLHINPGLAKVIRKKVMEYT